MNTNFLESFEKNWKNIKPFDVSYYYVMELKRELEKVILNYVPVNSKVLDSGCGIMPYREIIEKRSTNYTGLDIIDNNNDNYIKIVNNDYSVVENNEYDVFFSSQVLEHIQNTKEYFNHINRTLKKDGILILSTHGFWEYHPTPTDYKRWTSYGLKDEIRENGFEILYFKGVLSLPAACEQMKLLEVFRNSKTIFRYLHSFFMQFRIKNYDKKYYTRKQYDACTYIIAAKK